MGGLPKGSQGEWDANGMATICSEVIDRMKRSQGRYMPFPYQAKFGDTMMRETLRMSRSVFMGISSYQRRCLRCHVYDLYEHHELGSFQFVYKRHPNPRETKINRVCLVLSPSCPPIFLPKPEEVIDRMR